MGKIYEKMKIIEDEVKSVQKEMEFSGPDVHAVCKSLEKIMGDLKVFDQKRHKADQLDADLNLRFEAIVLCLEKITKILKENSLV